MMEIIPRIVEHMSDRVSGPMHFRVYLQPIMAISFAVLDGLKDVKTGKAPYFWSLLSDGPHRAERLRSGWQGVGKVFLLALVLDAIYQLMQQGFIYAGELVLVPFLLAIVPYVIVRALVGRFWPGPRGARP